MSRVPSLSDESLVLLANVREGRVVSVHLVGTVIFVVVLAAGAVHAGPDLGTDTGDLCGSSRCLNVVRTPLRVGWVWGGAYASDLELLGGFLAGVEDFADDFVAWADPIGGEGSPSACYLYRRVHQL